MKFSRSFLQDMDGETVEENIVEHSRWSVRFVRIFRYQGKFYRTAYSVGATEQQDESPYEYSPDEVECPEVVPVKKLITVYEPINP